MRLFASHYPDSEFGQVLPDQIDVDTSCCFDTNVAAR